MMMAPYLGRKRRETSKRRYSVMGHSGNTGGEEEEGEILFTGSKEGEKHSSPYKKYW